MDEQESRKLTQIVFERLICGESSESLRAQLATRNPTEADQIVAAAEERIARGFGTPEFASLRKQIRKRRLVAGKYLAWKILAWIIITLGFLSGIGSMLTNGQIGGPFGGIILGGIILAVVEWREHKRLHGDAEELGAEQLAVDEELIDTFA